MAEHTWEDVAKIAQDLRDASLSRVEPSLPDVPSELPRDVTNLPKQLLTENEVLITQTSPEHLVESLAIGKLTSTTVVAAFLR